MKVVLKIAYDGAGFAGFQRLPDGKSVQGSLEEALSKILNRPVALHGAGRTDKGVHANGQVVAFSVEGKPSLDPRRLCRSLNRLTRDPLTVLEASFLEDDDPFHPRYSALSRTYSYFLLSGCGPREALFWKHRAWCLPEVLDLDKARRAANQLLGEHDFSTFSYRMQEQETRVRTIRSMEITSEPANSLFSPAPGATRVLRLKVTANGFLRRMVRLLTAAVVETAQGLRDLDEVATLLALRDPARAPHPAPPGGLYLESIEYDPDPFRANPETNQYARAEYKPERRFKK